MCRLVKAKVSRAKDDAEKKTPRGEVASAVIDSILAIAG